MSNKLEVEIKISGIPDETYIKVSYVGVSVQCEEDVDEEECANCGDTDDIMYDNDNGEYLCTSCQTKNKYVKYYDENLY